MTYPHRTFFKIMKTDYIQINLKQNNNNWNTVVDQDEHRGDKGALKLSC